MANGESRSNSSVNITIERNGTSEIQNGEENNFCKCLDDDDSPHWVTSLQQTLLRWKRKHSQTFCGFCLVSYLFYFVCAILYDWDNSIPLVIITGFVIFCIVYVFIRDNYGDTIQDYVFTPSSDWINARWHYIKWPLYACLSLGVLYYFLFVVIKEVKQIQSLIGLGLCILLPLITCKHPAQIKWRPVLWGFGFQFLLGILVLRWTPGYESVKWLAQEINKLLFYSFSGSARTFGDPWFLLHAFPMVVLPLEIWIGVLTSISFYFGLIQAFARKLGWVMKMTFQTTAIESISLAVNIFLSVMDTMIMLKRFLHKLTESEFHCFLVGAHSTIAGFAFGLFVIFGVQPQHLLTGAVMSAPAAVAIAKLNFPETEESQLKNDEDFDLENIDDHNVYMAARNGSNEALMSVIAIIVQTIVFVSLIIFADELVMWFGDRVDIEISLNILLSYMFLPVTYLIGIDSADLEEVSSMLGLKVLANEFLGFIELGRAQTNGTISERSGAIATYAMCGFSSFGTFTIFLGVWREVDPEKANSYAKAIPRLMMNSNLACFTTACIANILYNEEVTEGGERERFINIFNLVPSYEEILDYIGFPLY